MDENLISRMIKEINRSNKQDIKIMEVCGTHTHAIGKYGIRTLLNYDIQLLSGPGCPVCVTSESTIDAAIQILEHDNVILATFGDMVRVRGTYESIIDQRKKDKRIAILYTPFEALEIAENNKDKMVVFLAVGFETTAPVIASVVLLAKEKNISNIYFLCSIKLMPPILRFILDQDGQPIHGMICPGHVAAVMGEEYFRFIEMEYGIPAVIAGFEAIDIIGAIYTIAQSINNQGTEKFKNLYKRSVSIHGNLIAKETMNEVFEMASVDWRGIGYIQNSALIMRARYAQFDALKKFNIQLIPKENHLQCMCKEILMGIKSPRECNMFGTICIPSHPQGPCMISSEGSCASDYRYQL
jgi:hydrogenase expression/formation protein HypD